MDAIDLDTGVSVILDTHCIGCGLCITTCPNQAVHLVRKPETEQTPIPKDLSASAIHLGQARGKLGIPELLKMQVKSTVVRMLAPRDPDPH